MFDRNPNNSSRRSGLIAAILAVFLAAGSIPHDARANGSTTNTWHESNGCSAFFRVSHDAATCLTANWDNSPPVSSGYALGSRATVRNKCSNYGTVVAHLDVSGSGDWHIHLTNNEEYRGSLPLNDVSGVYCCLNASDLCHKSQVEKIASGPYAGHISRITTTASAIATTYEDVSTHHRRYNFCQSNPIDIYCRANPQGDALTVPTTPACSDDNTCNCGDHFCTADDCDSMWDDNAPATFSALDDRTSGGCAESDDASYSSSIDAADGTSQNCTIRTWCATDTQFGAYVDSNYVSMRAVKEVEFTVDANASDIRQMYNLFNCSGVVKKGSCTGTAISTHISDQSVQLD